MVESSELVTSLLSVHTLSLSAGACDVLLKLQECLSITLRWRARSTGGGTRSKSCLLIEYAWLYGCMDL